jgi:TIR domain
MKIFVSWAGTRSRVLGTCMRSWLQELMHGDEIFHSDDIPKGSGWYNALTTALRACDAGIFCITPESLRSQWMLFEAGALSQISDKPGLFAYLYGIAEIDGPLGHFQATRFDRDDTRKFIGDLAAIRGTPDNGKILETFDSIWTTFEAKVLRLMALPIQDVLPDFPKLFEGSKTFNEPFPECSDQRWADRVARIAQIRERLSTSEYAEIMSSDPYFSGAYKTLINRLDLYDMHIVSHLIEHLDFESLTSKKREQLERVRKEIVDVVWCFQQRSEPPVFRESFEFESDASTPGRKMRIHEMQMRLNSRQLAADKIKLGRQSVNWGLDRIILYLAAGSGLISLSVDDLIALLRMEEEQARTRELVSGLEPLYYALECVDDSISGSLDPAKTGLLVELLDDVDRFIKARDGRDTGGQIRRRLDSLQHKLKGHAGHG